MLSSNTPTATVLRAISATTAGVLPVFLTGGLSVQIRAELEFSVAALGVAATLFFAASAIASAPLGRVVERAGSRTSMRAAALVSAVSLLGIAAAESWRELVAFLILGGVANATSNPAANMLLAGVIRRNRQGFAFGIKQAAIPTATLLSGLAAPLLALTVGWRAAFAGAAALALAIAVVAPREAWGAEPEEDHRPGSDRAGRGTLLVLALGLGLGSSAAVPLGSFLVESGVAAGLDPGAAGALLAAASAASIAVRFCAGWVADRRVRGHLRRVAILLAAGALGFALLALAQSPLLLVPGALLAFAAGWGWPGLFNFAVVNENRSQPAAATGLTQTGAYIGSALGPLLFGLVVEQLSYTAAWLGSATVALGAAVAMLVARRLVLRSRDELDGLPGRPAPGLAR